MKKIFIAIIVTLILVLVPSQILALSLAVSPARNKIILPMNGSYVAEYKIYQFVGNVTIQVRDLPIEVSPKSVNIISNGQIVPITFYGNREVGKGKYNDYLKFTAIGDNNVGVAVECKLVINQTDSGFPYWILGLAILIILISFILFRRHKNA